MYRKPKKNQPQLCPLCPPSPVCPQKTKANSFLLENTSPPQENLHTLFAFPVFKDYTKQTFQKKKGQHDKKKSDFSITFSTRYFACPRVQNASRKEALTKYKAECQKAEAIVTNAEAQYIKDLNKALAIAIKSSLYYLINEKSKWDNFLNNLEVLSNTEGSKQFLVSRKDLIKAMQADQAPVSKIMRFLPFYYS